MEEETSPVLICRLQTYQSPLGALFIVDVIDNCWPKLEGDEFNF